MKKLTLVLMLMLVSALVYAAPSRDNTDYYYDGTNFIFEDGTTALNGSTPVNGNSITTGGWGLTGGTSTYSNAQDAEGSGLSIRADADDGSITMTATDANNASYAGVVKYKQYLDDTDGCGSGYGYAAGIQYRDSTDAVAMTLYISRYSDNYWVDGAAGSFACIPQTWVEFMINHTGGNIYAYINGTLVKTEANTNGFGRLAFATHQDGAGTRPTLYYDDIWVCNSDTCPEAAVGDNPDDIMVVNSTAPINYTSDTALGELGGWNNTGSTYNIIYGNDNSPTVWFTTTGPASCALTNQTINYSSVVADVSGYNCSTTGSTYHGCTWGGALPDTTVPLHATCQTPNEGYEMSTTDWIDYPSNTFNFSSDTTGPGFANLTETPTDPANYSTNEQRYNFTVEVYDATTVDNVRLEGNFSRIGFLNYSMNSTAGNMWNFTIPGLLHAGVYSYRYFANDTGGNFNVTGFYTYTINIPTGGAGGGGAEQVNCLQVASITAYTPLNQTVQLNVTCFNTYATSKTITVTPPNGFAPSSDGQTMGSGASDYSLFTRTYIRGATDSDLNTMNASSVSGDVTATLNAFSWYTPIDPPSALATKRSTNWTIWNGSEWADPGVEYISLRCGSRQQSCEPVNQNATATQSIYRICNNGTVSAGAVYMYLNATCPLIDLLCDNDYTVADSTNLSTTPQDINGAINSAECIQVSCWANFNSPSVGCPFDIYANVTRT